MAAKMAAKNQDCLISLCNTLILGLSKSENPYFGSKLQFGKFQDGCQDGRQKVMIVRFPCVILGFQGYIKGGESIFWIEIIISKISRWPPKSQDCLISLCNTWISGL